MHTLEVFNRYDDLMRIILVLPEAEIPKWETLCREYGFSVKHDVRPGGETRFHTVRKNLHGLPGEALIAVHDGVRPLVDRSTIDRCFTAAEKYGNAVPCIEIPETLRKVEDGGNCHADRKKYRLIQTPQIFKGKLLKDAYDVQYMESFTDDASVVEHAGHSIFLVEGNTENIKITFEKDLIIATALMQHTGRL